MCPPVDPSSPFPSDRDRSPLPPPPDFSGAPSSFLPPPSARWVLDNGRGLAVTVLAIGATIQRIETPDREGNRANVVLGFADPETYATGNAPYFGVVAGRFANRIRAGRFALDGREHQLPVNDGPNHLHGGPDGFARRTWAGEEIATPEGRAVRLTLVSPDGDQGYPGALAASVTYTVTDDDTLRVAYEATTDAPTPLNLTQHSYFNLEGEGERDVLDHWLQVRASHYLPVDATAIPTGELAPVEGTPFDFRTPRRIGERIREAHPQLLVGRGYDHCLAFDRPDPDDGSLVDVIRVAAPGSGRTLAVATTEPGVQLYTGNFLDGSLRGTGGRMYRQSDGFCLETQRFPDSPNRPEFPNAILRPGEAWRSLTVFRFGVGG